MTRRIILAASAALALTSSAAVAQPQTPASAASEQLGDTALPGVSTGGELQPGGDTLSGPGGMENNVGTTGIVLPRASDRVEAGTVLDGGIEEAVPPRGGVPLETTPRAD